MHPVRASGGLEERVHVGDEDRGALVLELRLAVGILEGPRAAVGLGVDVLQLVAADRGGDADGVVAGSGEGDQVAAARTAVVGGRVARVGGRVVTRTGVGGGRAPGEGEGEEGCCCDGGDAVKSLHVRDAIARPRFAT